MSTFFLYNPLAGSKAGKNKKDMAMEIAKKHFDVTKSTFYDITKIDLADFNEKLNSEDIVVLCGGDGTINYYVNHISNIKGKLMYYPMGSGNDFVKDIGFDNKPIELTKYISNLPKVTVKGKEYKFLDNVGFGIDGYCCEVGDKMKIETPDKKINYAGIAIKGLLFNFKPEKAIVNVDGKEYSFNNVWVAPTMNGRFYGGGMMPTPDQDRKSDKISIMIFHGRPRILMLAKFPDMFKGLLGKHKKNTTILSGKNITVKFSRPCALQIDGETVLNVTEYSASK